MTNMDKGLTVPKWVLINRPKIPQNLTTNLSVPAKSLEFSLGIRSTWVDSNTWTVKIGEGSGPW